MRLQYTKIIGLILIIGSVSGCGMLGAMGGCSSSMLPGMRLNEEVGPGSLSLNGERDLPFEVVPSSQGYIKKDAALVYGIFNI